MVGEGSEEWVRERGRDSSRTGLVRGVNVGVSASVCVLSVSVAEFKGK